MVCWGGVRPRPGPRLPPLEGGGRQPCTGLLVVLPPVRKSPVRRACCACCRGAHTCRKDSGHGGGAGRAQMHVADAPAHGADVFHVRARLSDCRARCQRAPASLLCVTLVGSSYVLACAGNVLLGWGTGQMVVSVEGSVQRSLVHGVGSCLALCARRVSVIVNRVRAVRLLLSFGSKRATTSRDSRPPPRRTTHRSRRLHTRAPADLAASCACPHGCDRPAAPGLPYCDDCYGTMCECTCEPCARRLLPETRVHPLQRAAWAPCVRPGCPCTASWNGLPGEFCCRTCRGGQACAHNYHRQPFVVDTTETLPMSSLGPEEAM